MRGTEGGKVVSESECSVWGYIYEFTPIRIDRIA